jgi:hypothetical protein
MATLRFDSLYETYSEVCIDKHLFDTFPIENGLKQGNSSLPSLSTSPLEWVITKVFDNQRRLKLNGTQLRAHANENLLGENINTVKKNKKFWEN